MEEYVSNLLGYDASLLNSYSNNYVEGYILDVISTLLASGKSLHDFDGSNACVCANEEASTKNGWGCKAIGRSHVHRGYNMAAIHIECIDHPIGDTIHSMTANYWRTYDVIGGMPDLVYMSAYVHCNLAHSISAGNKDCRADRGCSTKGVAHILHINLSTDTSECIGVQGISFAGFACCEDEVAG